MNKHQLMTRKTANVLPGMPAPATPPEALSADRRRTIEQHALIEHGIHPMLGGPLNTNGRTCGDCARMRRRPPYIKCGLNESRSATTDIRLSWPACQMFQEATP